MTEPEPLLLCMENMDGEEVALKIEPQDNFHVFLEKAKVLLGHEVDITSITGKQRVALHTNVYNYLLEAEKHYEESAVNPGDVNDVIDKNEADDLVYFLDDGTQISASQIQFDNEDPLLDLTAEEIPFVRYKDDSADENDVNTLEVTIKNVNITDSPIARRSGKDKTSFANSLPFNPVCNTTNFEAQFEKYLETTTGDAFNNKTADITVGDDGTKSEDKIDSDDSNYLTRDEVLDMFKNTPVKPLPHNDNEKRKNVRKTDPTRVNKNRDAKPVTDVETGTDIDKPKCLICCNAVNDDKKLHLFDKEDQVLHRTEQRKHNSQLKIICDGCLTENFKASDSKSANETLDDEEYLVIRNNEQFIFHKTSDIDLKRYYANIINMNNMENKDKGKTSEDLELVNVELGPDGKIVTEPAYNNVKTDVTIEKNGNSSDVEIVEPEAVAEADVNVDDLGDVDEEVKQFLGECQSNVGNDAFKCRFCGKEFEDLDVVQGHRETHSLQTEDGEVFPCPLCDYDKGEPPESSPVAKRTRSAVKKNDIENGKQNEKESKETNNTNDTKEDKENVKNVEEDDSSDGDSIWIVQTGDDDEQLKSLLQITETKKEVNDLKRYKCFTCSKIFPNAESLETHRCRKARRGKQASLVEKEQDLMVPTQEDFLKRAQGRPRLSENKKANDPQVSKARKRKARGPDDPQVVTCHDCNESFTSKVRLKFHMQFHEPTKLLTPDGRYVCGQCEEVFTSETELFDHAHFRHNKRKRWQCPVADCGKTFLLRATLTKHSRTHTDTRRYVCVTCGKRFLDKQTLDEHGVTHLQIKPFQCHVCLKQLTRRSRLRMHMRAHEEEVLPALVLVCAVCSRACRDRADAQEHVVKSTACLAEFSSDIKEEPEATEQLSPTSGIVRHTVRVVEFPRVKQSIPKEVNNEASERLLSSLDDVARSVIRVVEIEKAFRCEYCEEVFYLEDALNNHRVSHKGVKNPFTCHICKVSFATYSRCTTHKTTHGFYKRSTADGHSEEATGPANAGILGYGGFPVVKHFLCEDCGRSYLHWTYFQVHRRMKHANENYVFKCNQCGLTFPNSWSATYHRKKMHSNDKEQDENSGFTKIMRENHRIPCRDCDEVLPNKIALYKHRQKEHCGDSLIDNDVKGSHGTTVCTECGENLATVASLRRHCKCSALRNHQLVHPGERAWRCGSCPRRFRLEADLTTHTWLKHRAHLAVIEIEGIQCSPEEVLKHLEQNGIARDDVVEVTMISFPKDSTNIVPDSLKALSLLSDVPRTKIPCTWHRPEVFQPTHHGGSTDEPPRPLTEALQHEEPIKAAPIILTYPHNAKTINNYPQTTQITTDVQNTQMTSNYPLNTQTLSGSYPQIENYPQNIPITNTYPQDSFITNTFPLNTQIMNTYPLNTKITNETSLFQNPQNTKKYPQSTQILNYFPHNSEIARITYPQVIRNTDTCDHNTQIISDAYPQNTQIIRDTYTQDVRIKNTYSQRTQIMNTFPQNPQIMNTYPQDTQIMNSCSQKTQIMDNYPQDTEINNTYPQHIKIMDTYPQDTQIMNTYPQNTQFMGTYPQDSQIMNTYPQNTQIMVTYPQTTQIMDTSPQDTQIMDTSPQDTQIMNTYPQNTQIMVTYPQSTQIMITSPQETQIMNTYPLNNEIINTYPQDTQIMNTYIE